MPCSDTMTNHDLPAELIDQVIDHLHDDVLSLRECSLTCRAWVPSSRFHLFHDVMLTAERAINFAVLLETSPHISLFVRNLFVKGNAFQLYGKSDHLDAAIPVISPKLTRLKALRIESLTLAQQRNTLSALIQNFSTLQSLSLSSVTFNRFRDFAAFIIAHPFLERLDLGQVWWNESVNAASQWEDVFKAYPELRSRLQSISLNDTSDNVLDWILSHYRVLPVHTLTISTSHIPQMAKLLQVLGQSLEHLSFSVYFSQHSSTTQELSNGAIISSNTCLRTLTFDHLLLTQRTPRQYAWVPALLSQVTSPYVEEITFILLWTRLEMLEALDLELLQDIISKSIFSGLKRVVFRLLGDLDPAEALRKISERMDRLAQSGLLVVYAEPITL